MLKNDDNILKKSINQLPVSTAPEAVWEAIEKELDREQNRDVLERAIASFKIDVIAPLSWEEFSKTLDNERRNDAVLKKAIADLPQQQFEKDIFNDIVAAYRHNFSLPKYAYWISGIAASILMVITINFLLHERNNEKVQLAFTEELISNSIDTHQIVTTQEGDEVLNFIQENCNILADKCQTPEFKGLLDTYNELNKSQKELLTQVEQNENQPQLVEYLVDVEKKRTEIGSQLIQFLITV